MDLLGLYLFCPRYYYLNLDDLSYLTINDVKKDFTVDKQLNICYKNKHLLTKFKKLYCGLDPKELKQIYEVIRYLKDEQYVDLDSLCIVDAANIDDYQYSDTDYQCCADDDEDYYNNCVKAIGKIYDYFTKIHDKYEKVFNNYTKKHNKSLFIDENKIADGRKTYLIKDTKNKIFSNDLVLYTKIINMLIWNGIIDGSHTQTPTINKKPIGDQIKRDIWDMYVGNIVQDVCYCCRNNKIYASSFAAGHVVPEIAGGSLDIENLRPICTTCNSSMGSTNLFVWLEQKRFTGWYRALKRESVAVYIYFAKQGKYSFDDFYTNYVNWLRQYKGCEPLNKIEVKHSVIGKGIYCSETNKVIID